MKVIILGAGLAGLSLAYFIQNNQKIESITLVEKENTVGGLCRSFSHGSIIYDVGPHIFFSKDKEILSFMIDLLGENINRLKRSNHIIHNGKMVGYPFENDLGSLPESECELCLNTFLNNPYHDYPADNMLQFFLKTFGEGITNLYLRPYNEKIWKFDPSFMDTQMVERIPKPPDDDVVSGANGKRVEGYLHQLYFSYPKQGGTERFIKAITEKLNNKVRIISGEEVILVEKRSNIFEVRTNCNQIIIGDRLVSTIPADILTSVYSNIPQSVKACGAKLKHNNIAIGVCTVSKDLVGDELAFTIADKDVVFHRLTKLDFFGEGYHMPNTVTYLIDVTYRESDRIDCLSNDQLRTEMIDGLIKIGFIECSDDIVSFSLKRYPYAYVIYDLKHRETMTKIRTYFKKEGIDLHGRFGNFEYLNMDAVIHESIKLAKEYDL